MKSKVTKLYDYTQAQVPNELRRWRLQEEEIEEKLAALSRGHARETDVEQVQAGDSVVCAGESAVERWNKPVLLFYPGSGLCEKVLEDSTVGMKTGESKTVAAGEGDVTLTVKRIVRREALPIDDALVKLEAIEGVETVEDYRRWYQEKTEKYNRDHNMAYLARHLLDTVVEKTEYEIDKAEELAWAEKNAEQLRRAEEANGIDPTVPEEGTDFLTEEQVKQKYIDRIKPFFRAGLTHAAVAVALSGKDEETVIQEELARQCERWYNHISVEELLAQFKGHEEDLRANALHIAAEELLRVYSEKLLED